MVLKTQPVGCAGLNNSLSSRGLPRRTRWRWQPTIWKVRHNCGTSFKESEEHVSWEAMKDGLHVRYSATQFDDFFGDLTKLRQTGTVREYQGQYERLLSRAGRLSVTQQVSGFISGLKESIRPEVQASRPPLSRLQWEWQGCMSSGCWHNYDPLISTTPGGPWARRIHLPYHPQALCGTDLR
jgi:hypothetical protein